MMNKSYLGLGSNQNMPIRQLHIARKLIHELPQTHCHRATDIILTKAFGVTRQANFYNQVLEIYTRLNPFELLKELQAIEQKLGRFRYLPWGPRCIDIDILCYEDLVLNRPQLRLPHPQIWTRAFVTRQLEELQAPIIKHDTPLS